MKGRSGILKECMGLNWASILENFFEYGFSERIFSLTTFCFQKLIVYRFLYFTLWYRIGKMTFRRWVLNLFWSIFDNVIMFSCCFERKITGFISRIFDSCRKSKHHQRTVWKVNAISGKFITLGNYYSIKFTIFSKMSLFLSLRWSSCHWMNNHLKVTLWTTKINKVFTASRWKNMCNINFYYCYNFESHEWKILFYFFKLKMLERRVALSLYVIEISSSMFLSRSFSLEFFFEFLLLYSWVCNLVI